MGTKEEIMLAAAGIEAQYDKIVKTLLLDPKILAPIIQMTIPEFSDIPVEIVESYLQGRISDEDPVDETSAMASHNLDSQKPSFSEKMIYFDAHMRVRNPKLSTGDIQIDMYIDLEIQNNLKEKALGYPLEKRAMYYVARELSSQLGVLTKETDYGKLCKSYSIWINNNVDDEYEGSIARYRITRSVICGNPPDSPADYDLMEVVMLYRNEKSGEKGIFDYLQGLFSGSLEQMGRYASKVSENEKIVEEVSKMSGFADIIAEKKLDEGRKERFAEDRENVIRNLLNRHSGWTREQAEKEADALLLAPV